MNMRGESSQMNHVTRVIHAMTRSKGRKRLYHMTRAENLPLIEQMNRLLSSQQLAPHLSGMLREQPITTVYEPFTVTLNAHLHIPESMMATGVSRLAFHAFLDRHVFCWPTIRECQYMIASYARREPGQPVCVLELDAAALLQDHAERVKLSRYDSGSAPRYPQRCNYRKSPAMFLKLDELGQRQETWLPSKPSDIREVLIEDSIDQLSKYLFHIYSTNQEAIPACWRPLWRPLSDLIL